MEGLEHEAEASRKELEDYEQYVLKQVESTHQYSPKQCQNSHHCASHSQQERVYAHYRKHKRRAKQYREERDGLLLEMSKLCSEMNSSRLRKYYSSRGEGEQ